MSIGYNLKLPNQKQSISVTSPVALDHTKYIEYEGSIYKVKRKYMTNIAGEIIEVATTDGKPEEIIKTEKFVNPFLL
ncbi:hypothetical protein [Cohnella sp. GCM10012308]|uniref:hypothetical protein n=1 Tax=Cohnella sp. GCM10012308 TaxID=3317329 RepID=UPI0036137D12